MTQFDLLSSLHLPGDLLFIILFFLLLAVCSFCNPQWADESSNNNNKKYNAPEYNLFSSSPDMQSTVEMPVMA
jgi:hypothetical protein